MALHAIVLVVMLYGTGALVYPEGRYSWLYKTIGVVQYVNAHGAAEQHHRYLPELARFFRSRRLVRESGRRRQPARLREVG